MQSMFTRIQARRFRGLRCVDQTLGNFHGLIGPNASGKTTFLDVLAFLSDMMRFRGDVAEAVHKRSSDFRKLVWKEQDSSFQLAVEAQIPVEFHAKLDEIHSKLKNGKKQYRIIRYEVQIGLESNEIGLDHETLTLLEVENPLKPVQRILFPEPRTSEREIFKQIRGKKGPGQKLAIKKNPGRNDNYYPEGADSYSPSFRLGRTLSALANVPADSKNFPVSLWFRDTLAEGVKNFVLDSQVIKQPSPPGLGRTFQTNGSNLPWVIHDLLLKDKERFKLWLNHVRTSLEDIKDIRVFERDEDKHKYLVIEYANSAVVPSWLVSDGTLRMLALTIPAYLRDLNGVLLIEEPENGIHPKAVETVVQSLSSIYHGQVLIATHSPVIVNQLDPGRILCFAKDEDGAVDVISGDQHPALRLWKASEPDLGTLFASGILS